MDPIKLLPPFEKIDVAMTLSDEQRSNWGLKMINPDAMYAKTKGAGIKVAILDTGIAMSHPDLQSNILETYNPYYDKVDVSDSLGHGTHCAGIISAIDNNIGVIGIAPESKLLVAKAMNNLGFGEWDKISKAILWAVSKGANIINMSLGDLNPPPEEFHEAIKYAVAQGVTVVAASGNDPEASSSNPSQMPVAYPARYEEVIAVAAVDEQGNVAPFSCVDNTLDAFAPGVNIYSAWKDNNYAMLSGTSQAAPMVAGVCALLKSYYGDQIKNYKDMMFYLKQTMASNASLGTLSQKYGVGVPDMMNVKVQSVGEPLDISEEEIADLNGKYGDYEEI